MAYESWVRTRWRVAQAKKGKTMSDPNETPEDQSVLEQQHQERVAQQTAGVEEPTAAGASYEDMSADDLSAEAERRGLAKSGSKAEIRARLEANDRGES